MCSSLQRGGSPEKSLALRRQGFPGKHVWGQLALQCRFSRNSESTPAARARCYPTFQRAHSSSLFYGPLRHRESGPLGARCYPSGMCICEQESCWEFGSSAPAAPHLVSPAGQPEEVADPFLQAPALLGVSPQTASSGGPCGGNLTISLADRTERRIEAYRSGLACAAVSASARMPQSAKPGFSPLGLLPQDDESLPLGLQP